MSQQTWQTWCPNCQKLVMGVRERPNHLLHFLIAFFTCGLWVIPWILFTIVADRSPYRCSTCGTAGVNR